MHLADMSDEAGDVYTHKVLCMPTLFCFHAHLALLIKVELHQQVIGCTEVNHTSLFSSVTATSP